MQNSEQIFAMALSLGKPWFIREIKFDKEISRLDIYLSFTKGYKFEMDVGKEYHAYDTVERSWQHLNFFQHVCYLHARVPKVKQADGRIKFPNTTSKEKSQRL